MKPEAGSGCWSGSSRLVGPQPGCWKAQGSGEVWVRVCGAGACQHEGRWYEDYRGGEPVSNTIRRPLSQIPSFRQLNLVVRLLKV